MIELFKYATRELKGIWHERYKDICAKVSAVEDWRNTDEASDELLYRLIYDTNNGVAVVGQAFLTWPVRERPHVGVYRDMLARLKDGLNAQYPSNEIAKCRKVWKEVAGRPAPSIFNRIVAAFLPGKVSPVIFEHDFYDAYNKLLRGRYIKSINVIAGEDPWHSTNVQLMDQLRKLLPNEKYEGAVMDIDDYSRGMFVWGIHDYVDMDVWRILRDARDRANK